MADNVAPLADEAVVDEAEIDALPGSHMLVEAKSNSDCTMEFII